MIGHNFHIFYSYSQFICLRRQKGFQSFIDSVYQHLSSVFRAEDIAYPKLNTQWAFDVYLFDNVIINSVLHFCKYKNNIIYLQYI